MLHDLSSLNLCEVLYCKLVNNELNQWGNNIFIKECLVLYNHNVLTINGYKDLNPIGRIFIIVDSSGV